MLASAGQHCLIGELASRAARVRVTNGRLGKAHARGNRPCRQFAPSKRAQRLEIFLTYTRNVAGEQPHQRTTKECLTEWLGAARTECDTAQCQPAIVLEQ